MTKLYIIRHTEAEGNLYRRMQGVTDGTVTDLGLRQIEALRERFREVHIDAVYSSDLYRTMMTATAVCLPKGLPLHLDSRLREINVGPWEDTAFGTTRYENPEKMRLFNEETCKWSLAGADTIQSLGARGIGALREIAEKNPGKSVAVVSHSYIISSMLCGLFYGYENFNQLGRSYNTAVSLLEYEDGAFRPVFIHDASHLEGKNLFRKRWTDADGLSELRFEPLTDIDMYIRCRRDAWKVVYGEEKMADFNGSGFWMDAQQTVGPDPQAMVSAYLGTAHAGMLQLSPDREKDKKIGYIPFVYLRESFRHKGLGIQLIGHASWFYRRLGREKLQLSVSPGNRNAIAFYEKYGFVHTGRHKGRYGNLLLMEKDIRIPQPPKEMRLIREGEA